MVVSVVVSGQLMEIHGFAFVGISYLCSSEVWVFKVTLSAEVHCTMYCVLEGSRFTQCSFVYACSL